MTTHSITHNPDGSIPESILNGLLQTRGGGVVAILATEGYFQSQWCLIEMLSAIAFAVSSKREERVRVCFIGIGISVEEIEQSTQAILETSGLKMEHQYHIVERENLLPANIKSVTKVIANWIVSRSIGLVAGATVGDCGEVLVEEVLGALEESGVTDSLLARLRVPGERPLIELTDLFYRRPSFFIDRLRKFLYERKATPAIEVCRQKLREYEKKWCEMEWEGARLEELHRIVREHL